MNPENCPQKECGGADQGNNLLPQQGTVSWMQEPVGGNEGIGRDLGAMCGLGGGVGVALLRVASV